MKKQLKKIQIKKGASGLTAAKGGCQSDCYHDNVGWVCRRCGCLTLFPDICDRWEPV